jgi:hypothetical protein
MTFAAPLALVPGLDSADRTPRELRHSFVSLLSDAGLPLGDIAQLVGHSGTTVTELDYRHQIRPSSRPAQRSWIGSSDTAAQVHSHSVGHSPGRCGALADRNQSLTWWAILGSNQ